MINSRQKGKRIELEIVNWMKDQGVLSAHRTQQFNGALGLADIEAKTELPSFHIEAKGTKDARLGRAKWLDWYHQLERDCPEHMISVLFHKANNCRIVGVLPAKSAVTLRLKALGLRAVKGDSFMPVEHVEEQVFCSEIAYTLWGFENYHPFIVGFETSPGKVLLAMDGKALLKVMLDYEAKIRLGKGLTGQTGLTLLSYNSRNATTGS